MLYIEVQEMCFCLSVLFDY